MIEKKPSLGVRLRSALRRIVKSVWVLIVPMSLDRLAAIQVWFEDGEKRRGTMPANRIKPLTYLGGNECGLGNGGLATRDLGVRR